VKLDANTPKIFHISKANPATINTLWNSSTIFHIANQKRLEEQLVHYCNQLQLGLWKDQSDGEYREHAWKDIWQQVADDH